MGQETNREDMKSALNWIERGCVYLEIEAPKVCSGVNNIFGDEVVEVFSKVRL